MTVLQFLRRRPAIASSGATNSSSGTSGPQALPILESSELLQPHQQAITQIQQQVGVPLAHWNALYESLLHNFAAFVQQLPASEAHHHRQAGGLLAHTLDATLKALTIRRGVLLPAGATPEQLADKQDLWTYATATATLLHDLGKPLVDQIVEFRDGQGRDLGRWNPLSGPMPISAGAYTVAFVHGRRYRLHPRIPPLLVQFIVPSLGLEWLTRDLDVFEAWLATISGGDSEFAGELGQIVKQADSLSVAADLAGGASQQAVASNPSRSFGERLAIAVRQLIDSQALPLNRPGAAGWVIGDDLWLVSKRALDALREQLAQDTGGASAPRNERLMDELQQYGIVMANGDRAIWKATIELADWRQSLTLLRVPLARLWLDPSSRPAAVAGRVTPDVEVAAPPDRPGTVSTAPADSGSILAATCAARNNTDAYVDLPVPPLDGFLLPPVAPSKGTPLAPNAERGHAPRTDFATTLPEPPSPPPAAFSADDAELQESNDSESTEKKDFFAWIRQGVSAGRLNVNTVGARIHVTPEGLLLVSPGIFRDFAGVDGWAQAQRAVQGLKLHLKNPDGTNIWTYRVIGERKSSARLKGILIPDATTHLGLTLPGPNPHLCLVPPEQDRKTVTRESTPEGSA